MTANMQPQSGEHPPKDTQREDPSLLKPVSATEDQVESPESMKVGDVDSTTAYEASARQGQGKPPRTAQEASLGTVTRFPENESSSQAGKKSLLFSSSCMLSISIGTERSDSMKLTRTDHQSPNTTTLKPIANNNEARKTLHVPNEIFFMILRLLPLKDRLSIRLVSKPFSELGAGTMFPTFVFKPNRDDFARIKTVAARPHLAAGIKSIRFESGTMDIYHIVAELATELSTDYNDMLWGLAEYNCSETRKRSAILEYAQWNSAWRSLRQDYKDLELLVSVLVKLPNLSSIVIARKACSFKSSSLVDAFAEGSFFSNFEQANEEFAAILAAVEVCMKDRVKSISHDELPVTFVTQFSTPMPDLTRPFRHLGTLHLTFDATEPPLVSFWKGLGAMLRVASNLTDLRFGFNPLFRWVSVEGAWDYSTEPENWYLPLWKLLGSFTFRKLKKLRLDGLLLCETGLTDLLMRHNATLQHLHLHRTGLWEGSFCSLLTSIRHGLALKTFDISGNTRAFHAWDEIWRILPARSLVPCPCPTGMRYYTIREYQRDNPESIFSFPGIAYDLSQFVLGQSDWKVEKNQALFVPPEDFHSPDCEDCWSIDRDEIDKKWSTTAEGDDEMWEVSEILAHGSR